jgi:hypothetical protein
MADTRFTEEEEQEISEVVAAGLTAGQGDFDELDFAAARADHIENLIKASTAGLLMEGRLGIVVDDKGVVRYMAIGDRPPAPQ